MQQGFTNIGISLLSKELRSSQLALATLLQTNFNRNNSKNFNPWTKTKMAKKANINPAHYARVLNDLVRKTGQDVKYNDETKKYESVVSLYTSGENHVQVPTYLLQTRQLTNSELFVLWYIKSFNGKEWYASAWKLYKALNNKLESLAITDINNNQFELSYTSILKALKRLTTLKLVIVKTSKFNLTDNTTGEVTPRNKYVSIRFNDVEWNKLIATPPDQNLDEKQKTTLDDNDGWAMDL